MDIKLAALKKGFFKHTANPGLLKEYSLIKYLKFCKTRSRLIKEIAYCLTTSIEERFSREIYAIAYNSTNISNWKFKLVYSRVKNYTKLEDIIIIDISILDNSSNRETLYSKYPLFKEDLITELNIINQHGKQF